MEFTSNYGLRSLPTVSVPLVILESIQKDVVKVLKHFDAEDIELTTSGVIWKYLGSEHGRSVTMQDDGKTSEVIVTYVSAKTFDKARTRYERDKYDEPMYGRHRPDKGWLEQMHNTFAARVPGYQSKYPAFASVEGFGYFIADGQCIQVEYRNCEIEEKSAAEPLHSFARDLASLAYHEPTSFQGLPTSLTCNNGLLDLMIPMEIPTSYRDLELQRSLPEHLRTEGQKALSWINCLPAVLNYGVDCLTVSEFKHLSLGEQSEDTLLCLIHPEVRERYIILKSDVLEPNCVTRYVFIERESSSGAHRYFLMEMFFEEVLNEFAYLPPNDHEDIHTAFNNAVDNV